MFKKITLFLALGLVLLGLNANSQTTRFIVNPASSDLEIGDTLVVAVTSQDFTDVIAFTYSMNWDPNVLQFIEGDDQIVPVNIPPALFAGTNMATIGNLTFGWNDPFLNPMSVADDVVLYEIVRFTAIGAGNSFINLSGNPAAANVVTTTSDEVPLFTNATVNVTDPNAPTTPDFECMFNDFGLAILPDSAATGEQLCLDVQMCNADSLVSFQYSLDFNPAILQFDSIANINLPQPGSVFDNSNNTDGWVFTFWTDTLGMGIDIPDTLAYELCFTVIGAGGEMDTVNIVGTPGIIEVTKSSNPGVNIGMEIQDAPIVVSGMSESAITLIAANVEGSPGDTVCVAVTAQNFNEVTSFQYTFNFDETNLQYLEHRNFNSDIPNLSAAINDSPMFSDTGAILVVYPNPGGMSSTLMDGDTLYEVCFIIDPMATIGTDALVGFSDNPIARSASQTTPVPLLSNNGNVSVIPAAGSGDFELTIGTSTFCPDSSICVPITVDDGFTNVSGGGFRVNFLPADLTYTGLENLNPAFTAGQVNWLDNNPNGTDRIILIMNNNSMDQGGINLGPGEIIFELCFTANNSTDVTSPIILSPTNTPEFVDPNFNSITPVTINDGAAVIETSACPAGEVDITVTETIVNVLCNGDATGSISLDIAGGDGTFAISWTGSPTDVSGLTTPMISNLEAGSYTVSITSGTRDFTETYTISQPAALTGTTSFTDVTCNGDADGTITLTPAGGVGPYTFVWSHGPTDQNLTNLTPGNYTVTITDVNLCTFIVPGVTITQPQILAITIDNTDNVSCLDGNNGAITTSVSGGNGGNMYAWDGTTQTTANISNLTAGNYRVTVTDSEGCTAVSPVVTITQPSTAVGITVDNIIPANCNGGGSIFITPTGGDNVYNYAWNAPTGRTTQDNEDIPAGGYVVTVTDNSGCSFTSEILVVETTPAITINEIITPPNCDSEANGAINLTVSGGTVEVGSGTEFTFNWSNMETTEDLTGLSAGDYEVTITDTGDGCTATAMYQLTNSINLILTEISSTPAGCAGATNGSVTIQVNGGGNYSYNWSEPGQNTATLSNVAADNYTVTVTDNNSNCTEVGSFTVNSDGGITVTGTPTDASCNDATNGSIDIMVAGAGNNPTFLWSDNTTQTEDISNIPDGDYVVTVTSTDGQCTQTAAFTVGAGNGFDIELDGIGQATCDGADNGTVNITVNGASGTPSYSWSTGSTTEDISNATGGETVSVTVTDGASCVETASYLIPAGNGFDINLVSLDNASCGGAEDGAIDIELDGAQLPLTTLEWNTIPPTLTEDLSGVAAGTYTVFITDAAGCNAMATYTVDNDGGISGAVQSVTDVTCNGSMDGSITLDILNASNNLSFAWSQAEATGQNPIGLPAATYSVTITDNDSGCTDVITDIVVGNPDPITFTSAVEDASCNGADDGMITITPDGGNGGFSYEWSHDATLIGNVASGLAPASYIVTITDSRGCNVTTEGIVVGEPTAISVTGDVTNVSGAGNDGAITAMATGGSGTYVSYEWDGPTGMLSGQTITGLIPGAYVVTVTDDNGCTGTATFTINAADAPNPSLVVVTNVTCFDGNDGAITIDVTGGSGGYTYTWQGPTNIPNDVQDPTGLTAGTYNVTVTDNNGVSGILSSIVVGQPEELGYDLMDLISVSCPGFMDGEISINPTGGNGEPYIVDWGFFADDSLNLEGLSAGSYTPTITDALGCTVEGDNIIVQEPMAITITEELTDPSCINGGDSGSIVLEVTGGTQGGGYIYNWDGPGAPFPSTPQLTNIGPGNYFVTVTDSRGCTATDGPYTLEDPGAIFIQLDSVRHVRCAGIAEGAIFVTTSGGSGNLMPEWKNGQGTVINTGFDIEGLIGGNYTLCVTDAAGCSETLGPITVNEPQPITVGDIEIENASASADDGEIRLIAVTGGTPFPTIPPTYTYNWEGPNGAMQTTNVPTITNIPPGEWRVTIVDANGCTEVITDMIVEGSLNVQPIINDPTCNGSMDGSIELIVNAGTAPFQFNWSEFNGGCCIVQSAPNQFNLGGGSYSVTVTDDNGVIVIDTFELNDPIAMTVDIEITNQTGANCNGRVDTDVQGGTLPHTYIWNNGATTSDLIDVCKGEYEVTITDANGCILIPPSAFVTGGPLSWANFTPGGAACVGGDGGFLNGEVSGGCEPYTFTLAGPTPSIMTSNDGFANFTGLAAGMYEITVTDAAGSTPLVNSFEIQETLITIVADTIINNTGMGMCNGAVNISVTGGQLPYTYQWSNGATSPDVSDVCENQSPLDVVVTDANGCIVQSQQFIVIAGLSIDLALSNETCADEADGSIITTVVGGNAPYTYEWSNGETTTNLTGLTPGSYTLTVTDSQGRTVSASGTINGSSAPITVTSDVTTPTGANADGAIDLTVSGGTAPYDYAWSNGMFTQDIAGLTSGTYTVVITDAFDCVYSETFNLDGIAIGLEFEAVWNGCAGQAGDLGTLTVIASGGAGGYTYLWDVQNSTADIIGGLAPGDYTVTVTDASGLTAVDTGTVTEAEEITIDLEVDEVNSNIISTVSGGTGPYNYSWNDAPTFSSTRDLMDVPSGTYTLVISDANGCVNQATVELLAGPCEKVRKVISPNNDGFNDEFIVSCANRFDIDLEIYNRWGQLEFMAASYSNNWVGTDMEGAKLPEGGYFYVIRYQDSEGQTQQIKGSLNIVY